MQDIITCITESQAPWMALSAVLVMFIIKMQNDKLTQLVEMMFKLVVLYEGHDGRATKIESHTNYIKDWCLKNGRVPDENVPE